ncbi:MAG: ATP-dependent RNA helicase RhlB [Gammaproteobacteria bacterium]|nr:ATP-dependent RNA helicase RhlB [Gammaproteobacteria bacterium]|tara:strand:- start:24 stop:1193 length:1170 start_codon:yes stop_codon:yes gene_type:complete
MADIGEQFLNLDLPNEINKAIFDLGYERPTPIQQQALPHALNGEDIIGQAQTGTGKTAAFLISIFTYELENPPTEDRKPGTPFALIIAPTRELVIQIKKDADALAIYTDIKTLALVGGIDYEKQKNKLNRKVDLVIATPGRLLDFSRSGTIDLSRVEILVIDEADRMLSMGFIPDVKSIIAKTPHRRQRQTQLFSATYTTDIRRLASQWTLDPIKIDIAPEKIAVETVEQRAFLVAEDDKFQLLINVIEHYEMSRVLIFVNRRDTARELHGKITKDGFVCGLLAGDVPQRKRIRTLEKFRAGDTRILVATDVAGRGIHIDNISHVINYNLPEDPEDYVHRIGRTGRAGSEGISISLVCETDAFSLPGIEELLGNKLNCEQPPDKLLLPV